MNKISIMYIGSKDKKRDTVTGSRLVFPRGIAVDVESAIALQLLEYPTVIIKADEAKDFAEKQAAEVEAQELQKLAEIERLAMEAKANSFEVKVGDQVIDIGKYTSAQLLTLIESEELGIQKGAQEKVDDLRARVREALKAKSGSAADGKA